MYLKNRIWMILCVAVMTVSFLHLFFGETVYAEPGESESGTEQNIGISDTAPKKGQKNRYEYSGSDVTWTVPVSGYYDLYCYGAQGGKGGYEGNYKSYASEGSNGEMRAARAFLQKGTELVLRVGQMPSAGFCDYGEGATNGTKYEGREENSVNDFLTCYYFRLYWGSRTFGEAYRYRGYSDGSYGEEKHTVCDSDEDHSGGAVGGGGGGSSYILCNGEKILSAKGGNGGESHYVCTDGHGTALGGEGGGITTLAEAEGIIWKLSEKDELAEGENAGHGYIVIEVVNVGPIVSLEAVPGEWTKGDVRITATVESEGQGLVAECFSWEIDEEGKDIWTASKEIVVSENGTYICKVRDKAGNISESPIEIKNIDRLSPVGEIMADITDWTKESVHLKAVCEDAEASEIYGKSGLADKAYLWNCENSKEAENEWTEVNEYAVSQNGTYSCKIQDEAGNITEISYKVENIDVTAPELSYEKKEKWYDGEMGITLMAEDLQPDGSRGCGVAKDCYSFDGIHFGEESEMEIKAEGIYSVWVRDRLGNAKEIKLELLHDKRTDEDNKKEQEGSAENGENIEEEILEEYLPEDLLVIEAEEDSGKHGGKTEEKVPDLKEEKSGEIGSVEILMMATPKTEQKEHRALGLETEKEPKIPESGLQELRVKEETQKAVHWKRIVLYSVWMVVVLCGLVWMLFSLIFEHVTIYRNDGTGKYCKIGRCAIFRKKEYFQINLIHLMGREEKRDYRIGFAKLFVWRHKKDKILIRTWNGVELRNVAEKIDLYYY